MYQLLREKKSEVIIHRRFPRNVFHFVTHEQPATGLNIFIKRCLCNTQRKYLINTIKLSKKLAVLTTKETFSLCSVVFLGKQCVYPSTEQLCSFWKSCWTKACRQDSFSFSWRWRRSTRKGPYALHPVSQQSPQSCPRNSANICLVEHRSFLTLEGGMSAASFLHSSFLLATNAVMLWCRQALCPTHLGVTVSLRDYSQTFSESNPVLVFAVTCFCSEKSYI